MKVLLATAFALGTLATAASAVTITITDFTRDAFAEANSALSNVVSEDFESIGAGTGTAEITPGTALDTGTVGTFQTLGGHGTGGTVRGLFGNTGHNIAIRSGNVYGRRDIVGGQYYLDSNDTHGIGWDVQSSQGLFNSVILAVTDASEFRNSYLRISANGVEAEQRTGRRLGNGNTSLVVITFDALVSSAQIDLGGYRNRGGSRMTNDGFSIDGVSVGIATVPLPATLPFLALGLGALMVLRRKDMI